MESVDDQGLGSPPWASILWAKKVTKNTKTGARTQETIKRRETKKNEGGDQEVRPGGRRAHLLVLGIADYLPLLLPKLGQVDAPRGLAPPPGVLAKKKTRGRRDKRKLRRRRRRRRAGGRAGGWEERSILLPQQKASSLRQHARPGRDGVLFLRRRTNLRPARHRPDGPPGARDVLGLPPLLSPQGHAVERPEADEVEDVGHEHALDASVERAGAEQAGDARWGRGVLGP